MKKLRYLLVFLILGTTCFSQDHEKLPTKPWKEIVEMNNDYQQITKWDTDIYVSLEGNYTAEDSITIGNILKKLDALTETISIQFSKSEKPNFKIKFLDTVLKEGNSYTTSRFGYQGQGYSSCELYIYKIDEGDTDLDIRKSLESRIAKALVGGTFAYPLIEEKRNSIFNLMIALSNSKIPLNDEDKAIIEEVYKKGFEEKLAKAQNQFKDSVIKKIEEGRILRRDGSLWWVKNPVAIIFLPALILVLLGLFFIHKINKSINIKIKKDWLQFGIVAAIALLFADIIIVLYNYLYDFLTIPVEYQYTRIIIKDSILSTSLLLAILFPFLYLFRFIELKIQKTVKNLFAKTGLIFLSTGFLPFGCFLIFFFIFNNALSDQENYLFGKYQQNYLALSQVFLFLMAIASLRALIGYFLFKERNLMIENETKLANLRELKAKAELKSLQSQINPHFLYNSLNSIASLAPIDAQKTQKMAHSLSDLFKYSINRKDKKTSTVHDEIEMVKTYLDIEKIRFGERLQFTVAVDKDLENHEIPLFLIQPLVENAVKHGISRNEGMGRIDLKIAKEQNEIKISVSDNGPGFPEGLLSGHGLQTVFDLLRLTYGDKATLNWTNTPEKMIIITIPESI
ncbi:MULTISPECIES: histidine kinase [unclassified Arcicella]|uniref:sensor histidine kinase n=1 Tax=unclassified Arcicella TaxID=2644986 RepID=UPI002860CBEB|nr:MULTISPECIES: histidine kinase [unclassified Arcicella]MDR6564354.1 sensor histidine kinase YesM [Arcicella sp. BE51]MDR6814104.1 sensor histidine kinase YesM [Arcicella sp. BE140]MDR6825416.1 sensor histidine kinase YesM [Arcicella sp. BE139]